MNEVITIRMEAEDKARVEAEAKKLLFVCLSNSGAMVLNLRSVRIRSRVKVKVGRVLGKSWPGFKISRVSFPVPCGAMTVIGVSTLPLKGG